MAEEETSFKDKLKSLNFGTVPGGYRDSNSTSMYDKDALLDQIGHPDGRGSVFSKERVEDTRSTVRRKTREFLSEA
jgi:hypothetical protein